jgi:pyruvate/2-oxoglutarate dehydrogenase complex dihydrolipoamide dehydrogenase (E3) component
MHLACLGHLGFAPHIPIPIPPPLEIMCAPHSHVTSAKQAARRGCKSALIEKHLHGGDCLNVGCVPSKALIRAARAIREVKRAAQFGINVKGDVTIDFPFIMERMRKLRARIAPADAVSLSASFGVDVYTGNAKLTGPNTLEVGGKTLNFKKCVVATGGSPLVHPIPGLADVPYHTNQQLFNLTSLPPRMVVIGAGPIGMEMAQSFAMFGSEVTVVDLSPKVLAREDQDAAALVEKSVAADGVKFEMGIKNMKIAHEAESARAKEFPLIKVTFDDSNGVPTVLECECLLVSTGRKPNVHGIGLEEANVKFHPSFGIEVDDLMQSTTNPNVYAVGDCTTKWQFTHMAGTMAQMVVSNALFNGERKVSELVIPRCTYTTPEVAGTGISEAELIQNKIEYDTFISHLNHNDRAILEENDHGFVKILCRKGTDNILGATIVAENAGDFISEVTVAIQAGVGLGAIGRTIHPYPTQAEAIAGCGFQFNFPRLPKM